MNRLRMTWFALVVLCAAPLLLGAGPTGCEVDGPFGKIGIGPRPVPRPHRPEEVGRFQDDQGRWWVLVDTNEDGVADMVLGPDGKYYRIQDPGILYAVTPPVVLPSGEVEFATLSDEQIIALIGGDPWNPPSIRADLHMLNMETGECDVTIHCSSDVPPPTLVDPAVTCSLCQAPGDPNITQCRLQGPVEKVFEVVDGMLSVPTWTYNFTDSNSGDEYDVLVDNTGVEIQRNGEVIHTLAR